MWCALAFHLTAFLREGVRNDKYLTCFDLGDIKPSMEEIM